MYIFEQETAVFIYLVFRMNIISGCARNLILCDLPDAEVRPTAARARKALFDSLGEFSGKGVLDLFSGSGALALESASRGAKWAAMVENSSAHIENIRENCRRVTAAGSETEMIILESNAADFHRYKMHLPSAPDIIFADPPYARSADFFNLIIGNDSFCSFASGAEIFWEIPDTPGAMGEFITAPFPGEKRFRRFGSSVFLKGIIK